MAVFNSAFPILPGKEDAARAFASAEKSFDISQEQRFSLYAILSRISRGRAVGDLGRLQEARAEMALGIDEARRNGVGFMLPMMESWLADMYAKDGENERALSIVEGVLVNIGDVTGRSWEAELHRQRAQILLAINPSKISEAESYLTKSIEVARGQVPSRWNYAPRQALQNSGRRKEDLMRRAHY